MAYRPLTLHPGRDPWDRQPDESAKAHARFITYRDTKPTERSYRAVAESYGCSLVTIEKQASAHRWQDRVAAYDTHEARTRRARMHERDEELCRAQMDIARTASAVAIKSVRDIAESGQLLDPAVLPKWVEMIERLRRVALDAPDQVVEITGADGGPVQVEGRFSGLSESERIEAYNEAARGWMRVIEGGLK